MKEVHIFVKQNTRQMEILIIEIENVHTGKITISKEQVIGLNTEIKKQEYKSTLISRMSNMHLRTDYKLSRVYFKK